MGDEIDVTSPADTDIVANYPADERADRLATRNLLVDEHYVGVANENKHKMGVYVNDTARDLVITTPQEGNFAFQDGVAAAADAPRMLGVSFYDGADWLKGYFVPTGTVLMAAFDVATPPEGFLACDGAAVVQATYPDLFTVVGTAFDQQNGVAAPGGSDFRVPLIAGHSVVGVTAGDKGQLGWVTDVSGLRDVFVTGTYSGGSRAIYIVEITSSVSPNIFRWSDDGGATYTTGVSVAATTVLNNGLTLNWQATTGHSIGDIWALTAEPDLSVLGATVGVSAYIIKPPEFPTTAGVGSPNEGSIPLGESIDVEAHENTPHALVLGHMIKT